jgi:hypothetical protein
MAWNELPLGSSKTLFTTARLQWRPLAEDEPDGARIATLWGDPEKGAFAAVVQSPGDPPDVYTFIRRESYEV